MTEQKDKEQKLSEEVAYNGADLPEVGFLLVAEGGKKRSLRVINLDQYQDKDMVTKLYLDADKKYGESNVRYCKVITTKVSRQVEFFEG